MTQSSKSKGGYQKKGGITHLAIEIETYSYGSYSCLIKNHLLGLSASIKEQYQCCGKCDMELNHLWWYL